MNRNIQTGPMFNYHWFGICAISVGAFSMASFVVGQEPPEKKMAEKKAAGPAGPVAAPPTAPAAKAPGAKAVAEAPPSPVFNPESPAVENILAAKPKSPRDVMQAVISLGQLDRPDLAKQMLDQLLAAKLDAAALADLNHQFGSATFIQMLTSAPLAPQGRQLADVVFAAGAAESRNPERLALQIKQLSDPSSDVQASALEALAGGGSYAAAALFAALASPTPPARAALARRALIEIGDDAVRPLLAALEARDAATQLKALDGLSELDVPTDAVPYLLACAFSGTSSEEVRQAATRVLAKAYRGTPTKSDAAIILSRAAREFLEHDHPLIADEGDKVSLWRWDAVGHRPVMEAYPPRQASTVIAAKLASGLQQVAPDAAARGQLYLISLLESGVVRAGLDAPLPTGAGSEFELAAKMGVEAVNDALAQAMATGHPAAARGAADVLAAIGDAKLLTRDGASVSPLVEALRQPDRRLRMAATAAIMKFKPSAPFPGASLLTDSVADMARSTGKRGAAIAFSSIEPLQTLAGMTNALGYETMTATSGRQLVAAASQAADTEVILVSGRIDHSPAFDTVQALLRDPRTADAPICVMAELDQIEWLGQKYEGFPHVFVELRPISLDQMKRIILKATDLAGDRIPPANVRAQHVVQALEWLAQLAEAPPAVADARRYEPIAERALFRPATTIAAAKVMTRLGTPSSQLSLVDLASVATQPIESRQIAATAFRDSVRHFGLRLSPSEILRQYQRYNESAQLDAATQKVLSHVLDTLELSAKKQAANVSRPPRAP